MKIPTIGSPEVWPRFTQRIAQYLEPRLGYTIKSGASLKRPYINPSFSQAFLARVKRLKREYACNPTNPPQPTRPNA